MGSESCTIHLKGEKEWDRSFIKDFSWVVT